MDSALIACYVPVYLLLNHAQIFKSTNPAVSGPEELPLIINDRQRHNRTTFKLGPGIIDITYVHVY